MNKTLASNEPNMMELKRYAKICEPSVIVQYILVYRPDFS